MNPRSYPMGRIPGIARSCLHLAPERSPQQHVSPMGGRWLHPQERMVMGHLLCHTAPTPPCAGTGPARAKSPPNSPCSDCNRQKGKGPPEGWLRGADAAGAGIRGNILAQGASESRIILEERGQRARGLNYLKLGLSNHCRDPRLRAELAPS